MSDPDVIDTLAGLAPDSPLAQIRDRKPITREHAQASYRALFEPGDVEDVSLQERFGLATFVAGLHAQDEIAAFYAAGLERTAPVDGLTGALTAEIARGRANGPYGAYPKGPLSKEDVPGLVYSVAATAVLGPRLSAALAHVHMLVFHPRDASSAALQKLLDAGWSNPGIVTLSQLVAFLSFQIRAAAGLRTLAATPASIGSVP
jgi:CMD domain protein